LPQGTGLIGEDRLCYDATVYHIITNCVEEYRDESVNYEVVTKKYPSDMSDKEEF
jgi:hypothetical protein